MLREPLYLIEFIFPVRDNKKREILFLRLKKSFTVKFIAMNKCRKRLYFFVTLMLKGMGDYEIASICQSFTGNT